MSGLLAVLTATFAALLPITNPLGAVATFAALTAGQEPGRVRRQAWRTAVDVAAVLVVFALLGTLLLNALGVSLASLQIAGAIVVGHAGFRMLVPSEQMNSPEQQHARSKPDISFSPMALPLIAGPGAIGVVIALAARHPGAEARAGIVLGILVISVLIGVTLRWGTPLVDRMGPTGTGAMTRVMGFLILVIGVELGVHGIQALKL
ncbi:MarC family protein [Actinomyces sp.]|uniref:MarC family protein n=1 Tax=Actinomyces sp. TaxID=29317 RepID=UPI002897E6C2|nr:MarC family protein [Actinomyces sp.]